MTIPGVGQLTALAFVAAVDDPSRIRRSRDIGAYLSLVPGDISRARSTTPAASRNAGIGGCGPPIRGGGQCDADPLQGPAQTQGLGLRDRPAINDAQSVSCSGSPPCDHYARHAARRDRVRIGLSPAVHLPSRSPPRPRPSPSRASRSRRRVRWLPARRVICVTAPT
jgi:hypothetical protein